MSWRICTSLVRETLAKATYLQQRLRLRLPYAASYSSSITNCTELLDEDEEADEVMFNIEGFEEETSLMVLKKSRRSFERKDSVCASILAERKTHVKRMIKVQTALDPHAIKLKHKKLGGGPTLYQLQQQREDADNLSVSQKQLLDNIPIDYIKFLERLGFSDKKHKNKLQNTYMFRAKGFKVSSTGAEGIGIPVGTAQRNWPIFKHLLPEIAFAGHSNCGKSSLVNALTGLGAHKGPASVSDRAGWTNQISFFQLGRIPPKLTLVDFPGYGFAVATMEQKRNWKMMTTDYLKSREILSCCYVLVDCTRGICSQDRALLKKLKKLKIDWRVILTKCDILSSDMLLNSMLVVMEDLRNIGMFENSSVVNKSGRENNVRTETEEEEPGIEEIYSKVIPVSSTTGAGIQNLWDELIKCANRTSKPVLSEDGLENPRAVREHVRAKIMRKKEFLEATLLKLGGKKKRGSKGKISR